MANLTLGELRAKYPPEDRAEYDRAYAAAALAGQLAELVYTLRTRAGLTQTELARRMGTTQSSIARIEGGGSLPTLGMLARLAHATGTPLRLAAPGITRTPRSPPEPVMQLAGLGEARGPLAVRRACGDRGFANACAHACPAQVA